MSNKITAKEVKRKLRRISNERGYEYTYEAPWYEDEYGEQVQAEACYYTDSVGNPSCIVGALLQQVAPGALRRLHQFEWETHPPRGMPVLELGEGAVVDLGEWFTPEAMAMLSKAQWLQDGGSSWGETVDEIARQY